MNFLLKIAYLFFIGSLVGWGIEVVFRKFFSRANPTHKWINPGFLNGPYLPLYGFSLCVLYLLAGWEAYLPIADPLLRKLMLFIIMSICVTAVEYLAGLIFIQGMHIKLWDYSRQWGNINGIICPLFTFFWMILSASYYFFVHPHILEALEWLSKNLAFSFVIGFFFGVFAIDLAVSARLLTKIRRFAKDRGIVVRFEEFKAHIQEGRERRQEKARFLLSMYAHTPLAEQLHSYYEKRKSELEQILPKPKGPTGSGGVSRQGGPAGKGD